MDIRQLRRPRTAIAITLAAALTVAALSAAGVAMAGGFSSSGGPDSQLAAEKAGIAQTSAATRPHLPRPTAVPPVAGPAPAASVPHAYPSAGIHELGQSAKDIAGMWAVGYVPNSGATEWQMLTLAIWTPGPDGTVHLEDGYLNPPSSASSVSYHLATDSPRAIGTITVTSITGVPAAGITTNAILDGVVAHFKSTSGVTGTLNLGTGAWAFTSSEGSGL